MILVVALNHEQFEFWCHDQDPPINPRDQRAVVCLSASAPDSRAVHGRHLTADDRVVYYGPWYEGRHAMELADGLAPILGKWKTDFDKEPERA